MKILDVLRRAAARSLPERVDGDSDVDPQQVRELIDGGLLTAIDASSLSGPSYIDVRITFAGREYLRSRESEPAKAEERAVTKRGIEIDGDTLRGLRKNQALTQSELAKRADLSMLTVSNAERRGLVDASTLKKLGVALEVQVVDLHAKDVEEEIEYQSVFISYGGPDEVFARLLHDRLRSVGCDVFFFPESAKPGERLHRTMSDGVSEYDRVLLICSRSLNRPGFRRHLRA